MLLNSHSNLHVVRFFTKEKSIKPLCDFYVWKQKTTWDQMDVTQYLLSNLSYPSVHNKSRIIRLKFVHIQYKNPIWDLCYLCSPVLPVWTLDAFLISFKISWVFLFCLFKSILKDTIPLNKFHIIKMCFICDVLLILCLLTSEFFSLFRVHYLWGWGRGWGI